MRAPAKQGTPGTPARQRARSALPALALALAALAAAACGSGDGGGAPAGPTAGAAPASATAGTDAATALHRDPVHGFRVPYPADWRTVPPADGTVLFQAEAPRGGARFAVSVLPGQRPPGDNPAALAEALDRAYPASFAAFQRHQARMVQAAGGPALEYLFSHTAGDGARWTVLQQFLVHRGTVYVLTFTAPAGAFGGLRPVADGMLQGFAWEPAE